MSSPIENNQHYKAEASFRIILFFSNLFHIGQKKNQSLTKMYLLLLF